MAGGGDECGAMKSPTSDFEIIEKGGAELRHIIRAELAPETTTFIPAPDCKQPVGFIAYPAGGEERRHLHLPLERHIVGTSEVLFGRKGRCVLDVNDDAMELVARGEVKVGGGHGSRMVEDGLFSAGTTVLAEVHEDHDMRFFFPLELDFALTSAGLARSALTAYPEVNRPPGVNDWCACLVARRSGTTLAET